MYRRIIVGHDLLEGGNDALALGRLIADASDAELVVAGVFPEIDGYAAYGFEPDRRTQEEKFTVKVQSVADGAGAMAKAFQSSSAARGLHDLAEEIDADLVVVGSSRRSKFGEMLAGNVGLGLLHGSPCAVAIAPCGYADTATKLTSITLGFDGSHEAGMALEDAVELTRASGAKLRIVSCIDSPPIILGKGSGTSGGRGELNNRIETYMRGQLDRALQSVPKEVEAEATLLVGNPAKRLAEAAEGSDLLVLGSRAYGPLRRVLLGSISRSLIRSAPCPVLVHPRPAKAGVSPGESVVVAGAQ